jgi:hypothetical protein
MDTTTIRFDNGWEFTFPAAIVAFVLGIGALLVPVSLLAAVKWLNRRNSARHAKLPPNPP